MLVTISGPAGSGKTTVARELARQLGFVHVSVGDVFRALAKEHAMTLEEFSKYAEEHPDVDALIDHKQVELAQQRGDVVVDGRLSGWMLNGDIAVWLNAALEIRAQRIAQREGVQYKTALNETAMRDNSEAKRYRAFYDIDIFNLNVYSLVIDTARWNQFGVVAIIIKALEALNKGHSQ
ncbi:MAG: (d)CMP kinase [Halobacteriota archaeon]